MRKIALNTKEELNIYMSPVRQQLLRELSINGPMTPKALSEKLKISASSVQHHIKKLMPLGLVELDHTEAINGIRASFYKQAQVLVQIGLEKNDDGLYEEREALMQDSIARVHSGFCKQMRKRQSSQGDKTSENIWRWGDVLSGVVHLNTQESSELMKLIGEYIEQHSTPTKETTPWEYVIIAYNVEDISDD